MISGPLMLYWCYLLADLSALGSWPSFFFFFLSGKPPAGPVCGITPQDPSRAGSQKRKQLSDNELLFCDQTSAFSEEWIRKLGARQESHTRAHTHSLTCSIHTHIEAYLLISRSSCGHTHKEATNKLQVEPLFLSGLNLQYFLLHTEPTYKPNSIAHCI